MKKKRGERFHKGMHLNLKRNLISFGLLWFLVGVSVLR